MEFDVGHQGLDSSTPAEMQINCLRNFKLLLICIPLPVLSVGTK